ncbi:MAG: pentapeptide repeat-containing protein [Myxococcota bacterium]
MYKTLAGIARRWEGVPELAPAAARLSRHGRDEPPSSDAIEAAMLAAYPILTRPPWPQWLFRDIERLLDWDQRRLAPEEAPDSEVAAAIRTPAAALRLMAEGGSLRGAVWRDVRFGFSLAGYDLREATFHNCDLSGASLRGANLVGTTWVDCTLDEVDLSSARLERATFRMVSAKRLFAAGVDFGAARTAWRNVDEADFSGAKLNGADFSRATMDGIRLGGASLVAARLDQVQAPGLDLGDCDLRDASLRGANLEGARLEGACGHGLNLREANLKNADLSRFVGAHVDARGADLTDANLVEAQLDHVLLDDGNLERVRAIGASFVRGQFVRCSLRSARLAQACFRYADLSHAVLDEAALEATDLRDTNLHRVSSSEGAFDRADRRDHRGTDLDRAAAEAFVPRQTAEAS